MTTMKQMVMVILIGTLLVTNTLTFRLMEKRMNDAVDEAREQTKEYVLENIEVTGNEQDGFFVRLENKILEIELNAE